MNSTPLMVKVTLAVATAVAGALLAGCGSGTASSPAPAPAAPSSPAAAASDTAHTSASSQQVKNLAKRIEAAQQPEIDQMTAWLKAWNAPVPSAEDRTMGGLAAWDGPQ